MVTKLSLRAEFQVGNENLRSLLGTERGNPVTTREEFNYGIASSPSRSLRSLGLLAMTTKF